MFRPASVAVVLVGVCGCHGDHALSDVPIVGGSDRVRAAVRDELARFDAWVGPGRLKLDKIVIRPIPEDLHGRFYRVADRLELQEGLDEDLVPISLRHELCHALDHAEDLMGPPDPAFDRYAEALYRGADRDRARDNPRERRSEALARLCESGPLAADALVDPCPGDAPEGEGLFAFLVSEVWREHQAGSVRPSLPVRAGPFETWDALSVLPTEVDEWATLILQTGNSQSIRQVDLETGEQVGGLTALAESALRAPPTPAELEVSSLVGWPEGPATGFVELSPPGLGDAAPRVLWWTGEEWTTVPGACVTPDWAMRAAFTAGGRVWYAQGDGRSVDWTVLED